MVMFVFFVGFAWVWCVVWCVGLVFFGLCVYGLGMGWGIGEVWVYDGCSSCWVGLKMLGYKLRLALALEHVVHGCGRP